MNLNLRLSLCFVLFLLTANTYAQQRKGDSTFYQTPVNNAITYFKQAMGIQSGLYNGQEYVFYNQQKKDNVFFHDQEFWAVSTINYDGALFTDVPVMYDLFKDAVVIQLYDKTANYSLINEKIENFTLLNHHFIYKKSDSLSTNGLVSGLYDQLYNGKSEVLIKRKKELQITTTQQKLYLENNKLFVKKGLYHEVSSRAGLLSILKDKKKEIRKYINDNNIEFRNNLELALVTVVAYYDTLTQ
jgi:hypothetical protein